LTGTVTILLSTFDGERFLDAQLASFREQTHPAWRLRWRDDGSTDRSREIMTTFGMGLPDGQCESSGDDHAHQGIAGSFLTLLRRHVANEPTELVAFADQDDIWLPEKLARGVAALESAPPDIPTLYCARQMLVDERGRTLGPSPDIRRPPSFPAALTQNIATGCTVMLNPAAARLIASFEAPAGTLHDWWSYLVVAASGGRILVDPIPVVLYRQHGRNAVGAARNKFKRGAEALRRGPKEFMTLLALHVAALRGAGQSVSPGAAARLAEIDGALRGGIGERMRLLRALDLGRQTWAETAVFNLWFMIGSA
jgi:glycosyltransferase involved in cell wall biosynthesis